MINFLSGKVVLITGGANGIGAASALFSAQVGAKVIVADRDKKGADIVIEGLPGEGHTAIEMDVTSVSEVNAAMERIESVYKTLDALIHCAGIWKFGKDGVIDSVSEETWEQTLAVNLTGTFFVCRAAIPLLERNGGGAIVTVASVAALAGFERTTAYAASKGGIVAMSRVMALDLAEKKIRVNCLCPGVVETDLTREALSRHSPKLPLGRLGTPEDMAHTAIFLASDLASFSTGTVNVVDGGFVAT